MAVRGSQAFDTKDVAAPNSHARLLTLAADGWSDVALANEFGVSVPTVLKWKRLPIGYKPPRRGASGQNGGQEKSPGCDEPGA